MANFLLVLGFPKDPTKVPKTQGFCTENKDLGGVQLGVLVQPEICELGSADGHTFCSNFVKLTMIMVGLAAELLS